MGLVESISDQSVLESVKHLFHDTSISPVTAAEMREAHFIARNLLLAGGS